VGATAVQQTAIASAFYAAFLIQGRRCRPVRLYAACMGPVGL